MKHLLLVATVLPAMFFDTVSASKQNNSIPLNRTQFTVYLGNKHNAPRSKEQSKKQDATKKYKRAFMQRSPETIAKLVRAGCPQDTSVKRQKAVLAIVARTQQSFLKQELFNAGLDAGSFTRETAAQLGVAMQMQGKKLVTLAQQKRKKTKGQRYDKK